MIPIIHTTFKGMEHSDAVESLVRKEATKLQRFFDGITSCSVVIDKPKHHVEGSQYHVRIVLDVPGEQIVVSKDPSEHATLARTETQRVHKSQELDTVHKYAQVAVHDAFRRAGRRLEDYARRLAGAVKTHEPAPTAEVARLGEDFGFLRAPDGHEVYFHRNSVLDDGFEELRVGSAVRFVEEAGEQGAQASTVTPLAHHGV